MSMQDYHNFKRIPISNVEWDFFTGWRRFIFSDKGRAKRAKRKYSRRFRRKVRASLRGERSQS